MKNATDVTCKLPTPGELWRRVRSRISWEPDKESHSGASDRNVQAHSSHYPAPRHSYDRHPCNHLVAGGRRLIRSLAIPTGVESCSPGDRWSLHLPGTSADGRHNPVVRDGRQGHARSLGAHPEACGPGRLPPRPQSDDLRGNSRPAGRVSAHGFPAALLLVPRGCPRQCRLHPTLGRARARQTFWRRVPNLQAERAEMVSEVDAVGRWGGRPVLNGARPSRAALADLSAFRRSGSLQPRSPHSAWFGGWSTASSVFSMEMVRSMGLSQWRSVSTKPSDRYMRISPAISGSSQRKQSRSEGGQGQLCSSPASPSQLLSTC